MVGQKVSHYRIERRLGAGAMGEVFLAHDLALGRPVALKLLQQDFTSQARDRLTREAQLCTRLQHPGIATFFETGAVDDRVFIAMEYVRGETLRTALRSGIPPRERTIRIVSSLLEALVHANSAGVVHRDIKPENVMIAEDGTVKLLDFGLAFSHRPAGGELADEVTRTQLTASGSVIGTPGYIAPETISSTDVDGRADLFAVGAVMHELLSGVAAFPGDTMMARIATTLTRKPDPISGLTQNLQDILARALERDPGERFQTATEFLRALRGIGFETSASYPAKVAVFDLENRSGDPADDWIGAGIADSVASDLAGRPNAVVVPRAVLSRMTRGATDESPLALANQLGCRWAYLGGYQRMGSRLRVVVELIEVPTEQIVLSEKHDGEIETIFELQDRLARSVVDALTLDELSAPPEAPPAPALGAYECYVQAREQFMRLEKASLDEAERLVGEALRQEPDYADALALLGGIHGMHFTYTTDREHLASAERAARRALELAPDHVDARVWLSYALWRQGRREESIAAAHEVQQREPTNPWGFYFEAGLHADLGRFETAVERLQRAVALAPGFGFAWICLGYAHTELGNFDEAKWSLGRGTELESSGNMSTAGGDGLTAECHRRCGEFDQARRKCLAGLESAERTDHMYRDTFRAICLLVLARTALDQGDREAAGTALSQCSLHLKGRSRMLGGGFVRVQILALQAVCDSNPSLLAESSRVLADPDELDRSWLLSLSEWHTTALVKECSSRIHPVS